MRKFATHSEHEIRSVNPIECVLNHKFKMVHSGEEKISNNYLKKMSIITGRICILQPNGQRSRAAESG